MIIKPKVIIILGMHRSGTSCLAGMLESYGVFLHNVKTSSPFNKKGNRELPEIFNLQESVFNTVNADWSNPPKARIPSTGEMLSKYQQLIESFSGQQCWGFKDPRTIFTLHLWLSLLQDHDVNIVASFRHPMSVAQSLQQRNAFSITRGLNLWYQYNQALLSLSSSVNIDFINFSWPEKEYQQAVFELAKHYGLSCHSTSNGFFDSGLIHQRDIDQHELDGKILSCWNNLQSKAFPVEGLDADA